MRKMFGNCENRGNTPEVETSFSASSHLSGVVEEVGLDFRMICQLHVKTLSTSLLPPELALRVVGGCPGLVENLGEVESGGRVGMADRFKKRLEFHRVGE